VQLVQHLLTLHLRQRSGGLRPRTLGPWWLGRWSPTPVDCRRRYTQVSSSTACSIIPRCSRRPLHSRPGAAPPRVRIRFPGPRSPSGPWPTRPPLALPDDLPGHRAGVRLPENLELVLGRERAAPGALHQLRVRDRRHPPASRPVPVAYGSLHRPAGDLLLLFPPLSIRSSSNPTPCHSTLALWLSKSSSLRCLTLCWQRGAATSGSRP
jgi:hypothetical protein